MKQEQLLKAQRIQNELDFLRQFESRLDSEWLLNPGQASGWLPWIDTFLRKVRVFLRPEIRRRRDQLNAEFESL